MVTLPNSCTAHPCMRAAGSTRVLLPAEGYASKLHTHTRTPTTARSRCHVLKFGRGRNFRERTHTVERTFPGFFFLSFRVRLPNTILPSPREARERGYYLSTAIGLPCGKLTCRNSFHAPCVNTHAHTRVRPPARPPVCLVCQCARDISRRILG